MRIPTPREIGLLRRLHNEKNSAVITSEWTEGRGRLTRTLDIPPFCERIDRYFYDRQPQRIKNVFDEHPRCKSVIAVVDKRSATAFLNALKSPKDNAVNSPDPSELPDLSDYQTKKCKICSFFDIDKERPWRRQSIRFVVYDLENGNVHETKSLNHAKKLFHRWSARHVESVDAIKNEGEA